MVELQVERVRAEVVPVFLPVLRAWRELMSGYDVRDLRLIAGFLAQVEQVIDGEVRRNRDPWG